MLDSNIQSLEPIHHPHPQLHSKTETYLKITAPTVASSDWFPSHLLMPSDMDRRWILTWSTSDLPEISADYQMNKCVWYSTSQGVSLSYNMPLYVVWMIVLLIYVLLWQSEYQILIEGMLGWAETSPLYTQNDMDPCEDSCWVNRVLSCHTRCPRIQQGLSFTATSMPTSFSGSLYKVLKMS